MEDSNIVRRWYFVAIYTLLLLIIIYVVSHIYIPGAEIVKLSKQELTDINLILFGTQGDSALSEGASPFGLDSSHASDSLRKATVYNYIFSVRGPLCKNDSIGLRKHFEDFSTTQFAMVIANFPIRVKSYFWLTEGNGKPLARYCGNLEGSVYLEIVFWTWFGLIASLLYSVSEALQTSDFDRKQIGIHISKFFYSPIISLVIYFSINRLVSDGATSMAEFSHGTIVLAFILGFFSRRAIELIDKVKELILPLGTTTAADGNRRGQRNN